MSTSEVLMLLRPSLGLASPSLKIFSMTDISVAVVSSPQNATQSLTTIPAEITSLPILTVPATRGTWRREASSSWSAVEVMGWTMAP